jgi:hypothetical protein
MAAAAQLHNESTGRPVRLVRWMSRETIREL